MIITKKDRETILKYLFKEGVLVAQKDIFAPRHCLLSSVKNVHVIHLMQSLVSRKLVTENFNWGWFYWYLNEAGIEYLREYLHLPPDVVPMTLKKTARTGVRPGYEGREGGYRGDRPEGGYRRRFDDKKAGGAPGEFNPEFRRGGFGRGRPEFRGQRPGAPAAQ
eukprot:m51a1_g6653 puative 40S ribosomal protein S10e (164) ;mRNA; f:142064-142741